MLRNILLIALILVVAFAQRPDNYYASQTSSRGQQSEVQGFAAWNFNTNTWGETIPPTVSGGTVGINGIVAVGTGLLAYGDFTTIGTRPAAGLAYYDGSSWCAPEGVGLYTYTPNIYTTQYNNSATTAGSAFAATVVNNTDVYILGVFNQVGLQRGGYAGMVRLTWSTGGKFTINSIGSLNYNEQQDPSIPCNSCPRATQPSTGTRRKLAWYQRVGSPITFVYQDNYPSGNLFRWTVDTPNWVSITQQNNARNLSSAINDFDINSNNIFVVGNFYNDQDPDVTNRYVHIACSPDDGNTWKYVSNLPVPNFGNLPAFYDPSSNIQFPALTGTGLTSIVIQSSTTIFVAGGWRVTERNITVDNLAGQLQTRVFQLTVGGNYSIISERFVGLTYGALPDLAGPKIYKLSLWNNTLFAFGDFVAYRQVVPFTGSRFGVRYTNVYRGCACYVNNTWSPALGGFITNGADATPAGTSLNFATNVNNNWLWIASALPAGITSTYGILSGGVFGYGGANNIPLKSGRWNPVLQNQRFSAAYNWNNGMSQDGDIFALHMTKTGTDLIIGGQFDWIGSVRIGGIAAYNPKQDTVQPIGGGLYLLNNVGSYNGDNYYQNRRGGCVFDIEEWNGWLIAAGSFNRNNSGNCVSNIAMNKFRTNQAGWLPVDGGCDNNIRDVLVVGSILYATGDFSFCGTNAANYRGGLVRGRAPHSRIAMIDLSDSNGRWRNLGIGLQGGSGYAMAQRGGDLFVGGAFTTAGGVINSGGIAIWRNNGWVNVVAKCINGCSGRPPAVVPYQGSNGNAGFPTPATRKPTSCQLLRNINNLVFCGDTATNRLAYYTTDTWYQGGDLAIVTAPNQQNSLFAKNYTKSSYVIVPNAGTTGTDGLNYFTFDHSKQQFTPSYGGFSVAPAAISDSNIVTFSRLLFAVIVAIFVVFN